MTERDQAISPTTIEFQELSTEAGDFLHELNDPNLLKNREIPSRAKREFRKHQLTRLRATIAVLSAKREEFNRRMSEYIENLTRLVENLEKSAQSDENLSAGTAREHLVQTRVQCMHCSTERSFDELKVLFAKESEESFSQPTELYVLDHGSLKKGHFFCSSCGTQSLVIKAS